MTVTVDAKGHYLRDLLETPFTDEQLDDLLVGRLASPFQTVG